MQRPNLKIYAILIGVPALFLAVVLLFPFGKKQEEKKPTPSTSQEAFPSPTTFQGYQYKRISPTTNHQPPTTITPPVHPTGFTGVMEEQPPKEVVDLSAQKQELRSKTPLTQPGFTITFDYAEDKFVVTLQEPKGTNKSSFDQWLKTNYPAIPFDRFIFK